MVMLMTWVLGLEALLLAGSLHDMECARSTQAREGGESVVLLSIHLMLPSSVSPGVYQWPVLVAVPQPLLEAWKGPARLIEFDRATLAKGLYHDRCT